MKFSVNVGLQAAALGVTLAFGVLIGQATADQPWMRAAIDHLQQARGDLASATSDKGGHRVRAMRDVDAAIGEVRAGMEFDRRHY